MSYILDALNKAQAERELGRVPPLQGSASAIAGHAPAAARREVPRWLWPAVALVLLTVAVAAWWLGLMPAVPPGPAGPPAPLQPPAPMTQLAPSVPSPAPTPLMARAAPPAAAVEAAAVPAAAAPPVLPPVLPPPPVAAAPATGGEAVVALEALDPATRARLPRLAPGGAIHAAERSQRMVILDGQVLREGDALTDDVSVLTIEPQGVVLKLGERLGNRRVRLRP